MNTINERILAVRKEAKESQRSFGAKIGISGPSVAQIESGKNNPSEQTIRAICKEFNVNRRWLETGEGDPYVPAEPSDALAEEIAEIMKGESPMAQAIMTSLAAMPREWWDAWAVELHKRINAKKDR
jgi:transcriptional regulator with XRE-family HTH domain